MTARGVFRRLAWALAWAAFAACAAPHARRQALPKAAKKADPVLLERLFARAVSAYRQGDYRDAGWFVHDILELNPRHADALALRTKLQALDRADR